jgi:hypothetical protein
VGRGKLLAFSVPSGFSQCPLWSDSLRLPQSQRPLRLCGEMHSRLAPETRHLKPHSTISYRQVIFAVFPSIADTEQYFV